ncbi:MAG: alkaline phosphatase [Desulfobacterales bacterium]
MKMLKNVTKAAAAAACITTMLASSCWADHGYKHFLDRARSHGFKNVIVMIPDGCDETVQTAARWYKGEDLQVDKMANAAVEIHMANSVITGSAAAATAFATGHKTTVRFLGVGPSVDEYTNLDGFEPNAEPYAPVASILEAAKLKGMATGIAVTSRVTHATPAAFACHIQDRGWDNDIMEQMVYENIDVVFGGGARHLIPKGESYVTTFGDTWDGKRTDGEDLLEILLDRGYTFVDNRNDMLALNEGPVWGLFDDSHMQPDMDRIHFARHEPSLAEMVEKAIDILSQDEDGFFLMVEGSQVDWAGHNNDPIYMIKDFIAFDDAVKAACDFAETDGNTLVLAFPDHNTGGMKIGHYYTETPYTNTKISDLVDPLMGMTMTANGVIAKAVDPSNDMYLKETLLDNWGIDATDDDIAEIRALEPSLGLSYALARVISKNHTVFGWTTHGHNGETVPVWVYGADAPIGTIDNTDLARIAAKAMNTNLDVVTNHLYTDLDSLAHDYAIVDDGAGNLVVHVNGAELPINKDYMNYDGREIKLPGLTVYAPATGKVYISKKALWILRLL